MSADLLAEFGQPAPGTRPSSQQHTQYPKSSFFDDNIDLFPPKNVQSKRSNEASTATATDPWQSPVHQNFDIPLNPNSDVLFDAAFDTPANDEDDDWGEFEGPESETRDAPAAARSVAQSTGPPGQRVSGTIDLLDSLSMQDSEPTIKNQGKPLKVDNNQDQSNWDDDSFGDWGDFADAPVTRPSPKVPETRRKTARTVPAKPTPSACDDDTFDDWGDFADGPGVKAVPEPTTASSAAPGGAASAATVRPTNIPPPSVLLELLLDVFENLQKEATLTKTQLRSSKNLSPAASKIHNVLQSAARVIAGRGLRWKRDTILSQSMRIGPARAGKAGGMKLNSVNKQENIKEEQDAVDVINTWRERAAIFNAVLQSAGQRPIPPVSDPSALKVITAKADQGALKASHPCALCSLKRDERILRVDEQNVHDSFGEWWTEHWGHTACRQFWEANRHLLGQR